MFLTSYDVTALFTNVPLEETIQTLAKKAVNGNWFNDTHNLNICEGDLIELFAIATKDQRLVRAKRRRCDGFTITRHSKSNPIELR